MLSAFYLFLLRLLEIKEKSRIMLMADQKNIELSLLF
jgi:hypothetical protein